MALPCPGSPQSQHAHDSAHPLRENRRRTLHGGDLRAWSLDPSRNRECIHPECGSLIRPIKYCQAVYSPKPIVHQAGFDARGAEYAARYLRRWAQCPRTNNAFRKDDSSGIRCGSHNGAPPAVWLVPGRSVSRGYGNTGWMGSPTRISPSVRIPARSPPRWIRPSRTPSCVKLSRWPQGSHNRTPSNRTSPTRNCRPTR